MKRWTTWALALAMMLWAASALAADPLPSWNDGPSKRAIVAFVTQVTTAGGADFVAPEDRIAVFDNDGTLWAEKPVPFQAFFVNDRVRAMAKDRPEWNTTEPYRSAIHNDAKGLAAAGEKGLMELMAATHAGMSTQAFDTAVKDWIATARHPQTGKPYTAMVYQPMLELLAYLRANGFQTWIVSGGGQEFMRAWATPVYGIPPQQVIGSDGEMAYQVVDAQPVIVKLPKVSLVDDKAGKPVGIQRFIGRRPIFAFGNSDGDREMLEWTTAGAGARFAGLVHHTDAKREYAYDRTDKLAKLDKAWDQALKHGWTVVDMQREWKVVYPPGK